MLRHHQAWQRLGPTGPAPSLHSRGRWGQGDKRAPPEREGRPRALLPGCPVQPAAVPSHSSCHVSVLSPHPFPLIHSNPPHIQKHVPFGHFVSFHPYSNPTGWVVRWGSWGSPRSHGPEHGAGTWLSVFRLPVCGLRADLAPGFRPRQHSLYVPWLCGVLVWASWLSPNNVPYSFLGLLLLLCASHLSSLLSLLGSSPGPRPCALVSLMPFLSLVHCPLSQSSSAKNH